MPGSGAGAIRGRRKRGARASRRHASRSEPPAIAVGRHPDCGAGSRANSFANFTASRNPTDCQSAMNWMTSPLLPQPAPKQRYRPAASSTKNDAVRSRWNGQHALTRPPPSSNLTLASRSIVSRSDSEALSSAIQTAGYSLSCAATILDQPQGSTKSPPDCQASRSLHCRQIRLPGPSEKNMLRQLRQ